MKKLTKTAAFTDIHWGCKNNSEQHNKDCMSYVEWFCAQVKSDPSIDNIVFLGDWFENRSALNISTMNYSYAGAKMINDLGLPVFFIIGNHDLYQRNTRELYSTINFHEFSNFTVVNEPTVVDELGNGSLICPFLFHEEYDTLSKYAGLSTWWGHFEFKGFYVTGTSIKMPTGPDHTKFSGPTRIFSGHFHKRQIDSNIVYIGNAFPTNFSDVNDTTRGMAVYNHDSDTLDFIDWMDCPQYVSVKLSEVLNNSREIPRNARVKCEADVPLTFEDSTTIKKELAEQLNLREITIEETDEIEQLLTTEAAVVVDHQNTSVDDLVVQMLMGIVSDKISSTVLIEQYNTLGN